MEEKRIGDLTVPFFLAGGGACLTGRFHHPVGLDTLGADLLPARSAVDQDPHGLEVGIPATMGLVIGVADVVTETRSLATDLAKAGHVIA